MPFDPWWLSYPVLGALVGLMAGLLGVGGGAVTVAVLTPLFLAQGFPREQVVHMALGTSMAAIVLTSLSSARAHHAHGAVRWDVVRTITPGILAGTFAGTFVASRVESGPLAIFFAVFTAYVSGQMLLDIKPRPTRTLPGPVGVTGVGLGIGGISALVAIGGGSLTVPFLTWCNVPVRNAIATSAAVGFPIAVAGTLGYIVNGWGAQGMPPWTAGYIYIPALVLVAGVSVTMAPLGARLAHRLPVPLLKRIFAGVLLLLCTQMLLSLFG